MKINGFHASTSGGKKAITVSLALALVLAAISVVGAFAAPPAPTSNTSRTENQLRELSTARVWYNSARSNAADLVRTSDPAKAQQYLAEYAFALRQADTIVGSGGSVITTNNNNQPNVNGPQTSARQQLAMWLHMMRSLRDELTNGINDTSSS